MLALGQANLSFLRVAVLPVKDGYVSHQTGELASSPSGNLARQLFPLLLKINELYFDELMGIQRLAHGGDQILDEALFPHLHHRLQMMGQSSEMLSVGAFQHTSFIL